MKTQGKLISTTLKILRPCGKIEEVVITDNRKFMDEADFKKIKDATLAAGRGTALSYTHNREAVKEVKGAWNDVVNEGGEGYQSNNW